MKNLEAQSDESLLAQPPRSKRTRWIPRISLRGLLVLVTIGAVVIVVLIQSGVSGKPQQTGRELDVAVFGQGYFCLLSPTGEEYFTRNGRFEITADGHLAPRSDLISLHGWALSSGITVPPDYDSVEITPDGAVNVLIDRNELMVGMINLARFPNPERLREVMPQVFAATTKAGAEVIGSPGSLGFGFLQQGWLEGVGFRALTTERLMAIVALALLLQVWWRTYEQGRELVRLRAVVQGLSANQAIHTDRLRATETELLH